MALVFGSLGCDTSKAQEARATIVLDSAWMTPLAGNGLEVGGPAVPVSLPDAWNKKRQQGLWRYRLQFDLQVTPAQAWALYIPRAGNRLRVALNGRTIAQLGSFGDTAGDFAQRPHFFAVPDGVLHQGANQIDITLEGDLARYAGLSQVRVGPDRELRPVYGLRHNVQLGGSLIVVALCGVFGLLALALFAAVRQASDGFFALACFFCSVRTSYAVVEQVPFDFRLWAWIVDICYAGLVTTIVVFCVRALGMKGRFWNAVALAFLMASLVLVSWHAAEQRTDIRQIWTMLMLLFVLGVSLTLIWQWWRQRSAISAVLALAAAGGVALGAHDHWLVFYTPDGYGGFALARFALVFFILAMGWIIVDRVVARIREERALREAVARELEEKKTELSREFAVNTRLAAERAQAMEREKLIHDLHDGMGLQLNSLLGMVEKGDARPDEVQTEVRNSIEQLRTLVDGSESFDGSLAELLGHIRHRIDGRLRRQGIQLHWTGNTGENTPRVRPAAAVSLQRLVFELCTNVIKHAEASNVTVVVDVEGHPDAQARLRIRFEDDGHSARQGVVESGTGRRSLLRRVQELEGSHEETFESEQGWKHCIAIPLRCLVIEF